MICCMPHKMRNALAILLVVPSLAHAIGAIDPAITQRNVSTTVCVAHYTASVRPPVAYTNKIKAMFLADENAARRCILGQYKQTANWSTAVSACYKTAAKVTDKAKLAAFELDHIVPLSLGGHPTNIANLVLQLWDDARPKDVIETKTMHRMCDGKITLKQARAVFQKKGG